MLIKLPWPDKRLFPNWKRAHHWRSYRDAEKAARRDGQNTLLEALPPYERQRIKRGCDTIPVVVTFYPPDRRKRDDDGMIGAFKNWRDGLADGLGVDDYRFRPEYRFGDPEKPGRVEVEL